MSNQEDFNTTHPTGTEPVPLTPARAQQLWENRSQWGQVLRRLEVPLTGVIVNPEGLTQGESLWMEEYWAQFSSNSTWMDVFHRIRLDVGNRYIPRGPMQDNLSYLMQNAGLCIQLLGEAAELGHRKSREEGGAEQAENLKKAQEVCLENPDEFIPYG